MLDNWSRRQKRVFNRFFKDNDGLGIDEAFKELNDTRDIWLKLYEVIGRSGIKLSEYSIIQSFNLVNGILILKINYNRSFLIDTRNGKSLDETGIVRKFDNNFIIEKIIGKTGYFSIEELPDDICLELIDLYNENSDIFEKGSCINRKVEHNGDKAYLSMNIATGGIVLPFYGKHGEENCIFFNEGYNPDGMSGHCDHNTAVMMGHDAKLIRFPKELVNSYKVNPDAKKLEKKF